MISDTLYRIQQEIKESLQREKELKNGYLKEQSETDSLNGDEGVENLLTAAVGKQEEKGHQNSNGLRKFTPNTSTKGVMQKFIKSRGRLSMSSIKNEGMQNNDAAFKPAKIIVEKGKKMRNGFIPAEMKMKKELQEFQVREAELRQERRKSQPNLMAALQLEDENHFEHYDYSTNLKQLKPAKSMANLFNGDEDFNETNQLAACSLKPAKSLAALCDVSDDELDLPGTYSLIMQFEKMKSA